MDFNNVGASPLGREFVGFPSKRGIHRQVLRTRGSVKFLMKQGDLLSIEGLHKGQKLLVAALDASGKHKPEALGLTSAEAIDLSLFDSARLSSWLLGNGHPDPQNLKVSTLEAEGELFALKASEACTVWIISPFSAVDLAQGNSTSEIRISKKPAGNALEEFLPEPLGDIREEFTVAKGTAQSYTLREGEYVQIIDAEGQQCSDFMAFRSKGLDRGEEWMIDTTSTRSMVRGAYPGPGLLDKFFDARMRPMMNVVQDTCGRHDAFGLACTGRGYEERGFPGHLNCSDNISFATEKHGVTPRNAWPAINFFWNTWVCEHSHTLNTAESYSRAGDYVLMRAMDDLTCVTTACPDDIDPINGWNPTDIHVRIYKPDARIQRAVAYREKENAPMSVSTESAFHPRTSKLTTQFAPARDLWAPIAFPGVGTTAEYWTTRDAVSLQDMSGLRKFDIVGPDAEKLLQMATTRDVSKLAVHRGQYTLMCDDSGEVIDDGTLFRLAPELFRWCCGTEESGRALESLAADMGVQVRIHALGNSLPNLALQGPNSRDLLKEICFFQPTVPNLDHLKWFGVSVARIKHREGAPFMLARSGYTGELGYELFCAQDHATEIWDAIMEAGAPYGIEPMGNAALDILRIEAGLPAANAEFAPSVDAIEAGLSFALDFRKSDFKGKVALERNSKDPRRILKGLMTEVDDTVLAGAPILLGERQVGVVTSATRSPKFECTIAMARLNVEHAADGTELKIGLMDGRMKQIGAKVVPIPFYDPKRERARS
ncbi:MAG: DUF1989 domain-containing protein [Pseudomonadota bacterium]